MQPAAAAPEVVTHLPLLPLIQANDVVALGPGLGRSPAITAVVSAVLAQPAPLVLDADGLNALHTDRLRGRSTPAILTPHPGEFARLIGSDVATVQAAR